MANPWWTYPRIDNLGVYPDPAGPYYKPDSNIQLPPNYPIQALLPGTVTSVQNGVSWGQTVVTIKLDTPINGEATHTFYEHMSRSTVGVGQHIRTGDLIGYNNSGSPPLGFGLYSGDIYGSGSGWQQLQNDLKPGGAQLLNPVKLLDAAKNGTLVSNNAMNYSGGTSPSTGGSVDLQSFGTRVGLFVIAVLLVIFGLYLTFKPQADTLLSKAKSGIIKAGELAV